MRSTILQNCDRLRQTRHQDKYARNACLDPPRKCRKTVAPVIPPILKVWYPSIRLASCSTRQIKSSKSFKFAVRKLLCKNLPRRQLSEPQRCLPAPVIFCCIVMDLDAALARQLQVLYLLHGLGSAWQRICMRFTRQGMTVLQAQASVSLSSAQAEEQLQARQAGPRSQDSYTQQQSFASRLQSCLQHSLSVRFGFPITLQLLLYCHA